MDGEKHFNDGGEKGQKCMRGKKKYIYLILDFLPFHNPSLQRESRFSTRYSRYTKVTGFRKSPSNGLPTNCKATLLLKRQV